MLGQLAIHSTQLSLDYFLTPLRKNWLKVDHIPECQSQKYKTLRRNQTYLDTTQAKGKGLKR
jgi:hypothetical protein